MKRSSSPCFWIRCGISPKRPYCCCRERKPETPISNEAAEQIGILERKADEVIHDVFRRLNQTFITPLDPEDIHSLSTHLDDVIDSIEEASHRMVIYDIDPIPPVVIEVCRNIVASSKSLKLHSRR